MRATCARRSPTRTPLETLERVEDASRARSACRRLFPSRAPDRRVRNLSPFFLTYWEARADAVLRRLSPRERGEVRGLARRIRGVQLSMAEHVRRLSECARCVRRETGATGGACCRAAVGRIFRPIDGVFRRAIGVRAPEATRGSRDVSRCGYLGDHGCVLPSGTRPIVCAGFFCNHLIGELTRIGAWRPMRRDLRRLHGSVRRLEFRFDLHRRFRLPRSASMVDGSVGYLWNRLTGLFASLDANDPEDASERGEAAGAVPEEEDLGPSRGRLW